MESSTEILRKLLDERGVKYYDMQNRGIWFGISEDGKDHKYEAFEQTDGLIEIDVFDLTPEQAIAATLGCDDDYEAKMDALLCRLTNGKWSKSRAYDLDFMESCIDEEYEKAYAGESDREAELEALAKDLYENAVDFNFKGWMPYYRDRFAALGIEVDA